MLYVNIFRIKFLNEIHPSIFSLLKICASYMVGTRIASCLAGNA